MGYLCIWGGSRWVSPLLFLIFLAILFSYIKELIKIFVLIPVKKCRDCFETQLFLFSLRLHFSQKYLLSNFSLHFHFSQRYLLPVFSLQYLFPSMSLLLYFLGSLPPPCSFQHLLWSPPEYLCTETPQPEVRLTDKTSLNIQEI